jgi:uncharacterized damage-inducible protein DinB
MNAAEARRLYAYTDWANDRILASVAALPTEQFTREITSSYPSIRDTLIHIAFAEWLWLKRWKRRNPTAEPEWTKNATLPTLLDQFVATAEERRAFLEDQTDESLAAPLNYTSMKGDPFTHPLGELLVHCANHSTHHRGQIVTLLRQVGATPPNTDYTQFLRS